MKQQIRQLAEQAGLGYVLQPGVNPYIIADLAKFAQLIVNDCAAELDRLQEDYNNPGTYEPESYYVRMAAKAEAMAEAVDTIKYRYQYLDEEEE